MSRPQPKIKMIYTFVDILLVALLATFFLFPIVTSKTWRELFINTIAVLRIFLIGFILVFGYIWAGSLASKTNIFVAFPALALVSFIAIKLAEIKID